MNRQIGLFLAIFFCNCAYGQNMELRQLEYKLSTTHDSLAAMRLMNKIGFLIHMKSADSVFYYGVKANRLAERFGDLRGQADALTNIGIGLALKGLYSQSLTYYSKAYYAYAKVPDTGEMAGLLMNSAISYGFTADSGKAKGFAIRALRLTGHLGKDSVKSTLYANYVELCNLSNDSSRYYLDKAEEIARHFKDDRALVFIMQERAQLLLSQQKYQQAKPLILKSLSLARKHSWDYHEMEALNVYATYFMATDKPDSALNCYIKINNMANENGYIYWKVDVLKSILAVYKSKKDLAKQAEMGQLLITALENENTANNSFLGDYLKYQANLGQIDKLVQINSLNRKKQLWFVIATVIGLGATLIILAGYLRSRRHQKILNALNQKISRQNQSLKDNDEFRSRLLSILAHDFRAPLGQTLNMITLLRDDDLDHEMRLKFFDSVENDVNNILLTFDNILQWIKKQLDGYVLVNEELNLYELVKQSADIIRQTIDSKEIVFENLIPKELLINGDKEIVQFINRNLIHNAIKHAPVKSTVSVFVRQTDTEIIVGVSNQCDGMTAEQLNSLFSFRQSHSRGAGMALTLAKEFIELLNGKIWAESTPGDGATFYYSLKI